MILDPRHQRIEPVVDAINRVSIIFLCFCGRAILLIAYASKLRSIQPPSLRFGSESRIEPLADAINRVSTDFYASTRNPNSPTLPIPHSADPLIPVDPVSPRIKDRYFRHDLSRSNHLHWAYARMGFGGQRRIDILPHPCRLSVVAVTIRNLADSAGRNVEQENIILAVDLSVVGDEAAVGRPGDLTFVDGSVGELTRL